MQKAKWALTLTLTLAMALALPAAADGNDGPTGNDVTELRGAIVDAATGERLIGANVYFKDDRTHGTTTGLDGSFRLPRSGTSSTLVCSCIGYRSRELTVEASESDLQISMSEMGTQLAEASVFAYNPGRTEAGARSMERLAMNVMNVMSAKAIELSPDLTVGNALGRMSGITLERSESGEGQYAILRGMDKRYNYTLVNGVKIPSPDNKNRFVPLDIFPAELLDRIEVHKSLTPELEGDGIGGAVNLVMKDAPDRRTLSAHATLGYSALYFDRSFSTYNARAAASKSPNERWGTDYSVSAADFDMSPLRTSSRKFVPDMTAGLSYGDRLLNKRLGVMAAVSFQNNHRGKSSDIYYEAGSSTYGETTRRDFSEEQLRLGAHLKLDYALRPEHKLTWYNGYIHFRNTQVRDAQGQREEQVRLRRNRQSIFNSTLTGTHSLLDERLELGWRAVFSQADNRTPDNTQVNLTTARTGLQTLSVNPAATRRWEHNSDRDWAGYADATYRLDLPTAELELQAGGMLRDKQRTSFFNEYTFQAAADHRSQVRGEDWTDFDQLIMTPQRYGNLSDPLNYDASERVGAAYATARLAWGPWHVTAGLRAEHTDQGYYLLYPTAGARNEANQRYWDLLPSLHVKREVHTNANLRLSYSRAINRPSFFEIVPYTLIEEDYKERGNPDLKHTVADNLDLRYEWFPKPTEQIMAGIFYKRIQDPIEYGLEVSGQDTYYTPNNYGTAHNLGFELDVTKYFSRFGVKLNYTFTHSRITTSKIVEEANPDAGAETTVVTRSVEQTRPLFGQAAHVFNLSLLYKDTEHGWDAQLAFNFTGERLAIVSRYYENDSWEDAYPQLDFSLEKRFGQSGLSLFAKANNLLNLPLVQYTKRNWRNQNVTGAERHRGGILERKERFGQSLLVGVRFKL